jgi:hypothetical protein
MADDRRKKPWLPPRWFVLPFDVLDVEERAEEVSDESVGTVRRDHDEAARIGVVDLHVNTPLHRRHARNVAARRRWVDRDDGQHLLEFQPVVLIQLAGIPVQPIVRISMVALPFVSTTAELFSVAAQPLGAA